MSDFRRQMTDVGSQMSEDRGRRRLNSEFGRGKVEDRKKLNIEHRTSNIESSKGGQVLNGKR